MPLGDQGTDLTNLQVARSNFIQQLRDMSLNPRPSYSLDGQSLSPNEYQRQLIDKIDALNKLIQFESGPMELQTIATPGGVGPWPGGSSG